MSMLPKINSLPGTECQPPVSDGYRKICGRERGADMSGHIIFTLGGVHEEPVTILYEAPKEALQVTADIRVGVLLD